MVLLYRSIEADLALYHLVGDTAPFVRSATQNPWKNRISHWMSVNGFSRVRAPGRYLRSIGLSLFSHSGRIVPVWSMRFTSVLTFAAEPVGA